MTMLEKAAKALYEDWLALHRRNASPVAYESWETAPAEERQQVIASLRRALGEIRVPSASVLEAGPPEPYMDAHVWARMIDAILSE
jgi:hypothetical protein